MKLAVVFDNTVRQDTTGLYFLWAAERHNVDVTHIYPQRLPDIKDGFDLYLKVDDGLKQHSEWNPALRPCVYYCIDTHMEDAAWRHPVAQQFDHTFTAQKNGEFFLREGGAKSVSWLPLGCDEDLHRKHKDTKKKYDWSCVASPWRKRIDLWDRLLKEVPNGLVSSQAIFRDMALIYSQSRVVFNNSYNNDINMRFFEAFASGTFQICEKVVGNGMLDLGLDSYCDTFADENEMVAKFKYWLDPANETDREQLAHEGMEEVLNYHTYWHRLKAIAKYLDMRIE